MAFARAAAWLPALGFALYPLSVALALNVGVTPLRWEEVARAALVAVVPTAAALAGIAVVTRARSAAGLWFACVLLLFVSYGWLRASGWWLASASHEAWQPALLHTVVSLIAATGLLRPWDTRRRDPVPLNVLAGAMLAVNLATAAAAAVPAQSDRWRPITAQLTTPPEPTAAAAAAPARDIYYIVLDGFGRPDVLRQLYGLDLSEVVAALRGRGFYVPERARSNYAQTYLSLASTLNLTYLDLLPPAVGVSSSDRRPLAEMIRDNALMAMARRAGYAVAAVTSDYSATLAFDHLDDCACAQHGLSELEQVTIGATPLAALPLARWTHDAHRRKILDSFAALERPRPPGPPRFTFAHLIAPHPPFVFFADGRPRTPSQTLEGLRDGDHFRGRPAEYLDGYREQAAFVAARILRVVDTLLDRPGPKPAIVIHGDHGPGSRLRWEDPGRSSMAERFGIFAAYYLPDDAAPGHPAGPAFDLYPTMTPINGARALAARYFAADVERAPDDSRFSTWSHPFDLVSVTLE